MPKAPTDEEIQSWQVMLSDAQAIRDKLLNASKPCGNVTFYIACAMAAIEYGRASPYGIAYELNLLKEMASKMGNAIHAGLPTDGKGTISNTDNDS